MSRHVSLRADQDRVGKQRGTLVNFPSSRSPQSEGAMGGDESSPTNMVLTDALRAKDERLNRLVHERERFIHDLQSCILHALYAIQTGLNSVGPTRERPPAVTPTPAGLLRKRVNTLIRAVREKIFALERDTATGFELEAELRQLATVCRHFGDVMMTLSIDPYAASLLTREESRHLLQIARVVTFDSIRRHEASHLTIRLRNTNGRVCFNFKEGGKRPCRDSHRKLEMGLRSIPAQARRIGGRLAVRLQPHREISIVLDFGQERPRRTQKTAASPLLPVRTGRSHSQTLRPDPAQSPLYDSCKHEGVPLI